MTDPTLAFMIPNLIKIMNIGVGFYIINILLGGLYVITAVDGTFLGWLSLLHLLVGVSIFLTLATMYVLCSLTKTGEKSDTN